MSDSGCIGCDFLPGCFIQGVIEDVDLREMKTARVVYRKGETLCKEGGFASCVNFIIDGYVKFFVEGPDKRNIIVKIQQKGDFLGLSAVCGDETYLYSAAALTDTAVCSIDRDTVVDLLTANGDFALELTRWHCVSYGRVLRKLRTIGFKNLHGRMADTLLYLDNRGFREGNIYQYLTRTDLAELAGMPMESAVRILSEFSDSKLISISGKRVEIINQDMLQRLSRGG